MLSTPPFNITDNDRVDNSSISCGCDATGSVDWSERRLGGGHSSSSGAYVVVRSEATALVEGPGAGDGDDGGTACECRRCFCGCRHHI